MGSLASALRAELGDTTEENVRLAEAETFTAGSIEALQAYTRAQALADANKNEEALAAYKETVKLDPNLGRAYAGMGVIYTIFKDEENAKAAYEQAVKLVDRMTEREKYRTLGTSYMSIARNYEKAIENYETLVKLFPADDGGHANLGLAYLYAGNVQRAIEEVRKVLEIYPSQFNQRYNYAMYFDVRGRLRHRDRRRPARHQGSALLPAGIPAGGAVDIGQGAWTARSGCTASSKRVESRRRAGAVRACGPRDVSAASSGMTLEAPPERDSARRESRERRHPRARSGGHMPQAYLALGQRGRAAAPRGRAAQSSAHESVLVPAALTLLQAGDEKTAEEIAVTLENMLQTHTTAYARLITAELAFRRGRYPQAVEGFRDSIKRRDTWLGRYLLGRLYVETKHYPEAMAELEICLKRRGEVTDVFFYDTPSLRYLPPVYYWLARAQQALGVADARAELRALPRAARHRRSARSIGSGRPTADEADREVTNGAAARAAAPHVH